MKKIGMVKKRINNSYDIYEEVFDSFKKLAQLRPALYRVIKIPDHEFHRWQVLEHQRLKLLNKWFGP